MNTPLSRRRLRTHWTCRVAAALIALGSPAIATSTPPRVVAIRAAQWVDPSGELQEEALIVVRDGVIAQVGGKPPSGAPLIDFPDAVLCPGLVDVHSALGAERVVGGRLRSQLHEPANALTPEASAASAFDRYSRQLEAALEAGVTVFGFAPDDANVVGGRVAVARTAAADGKPALLSAEGPMKLSLSSATYMLDRAPTSRAGAVEMLRNALLAARQAGPEDPLGRLLAGRCGAIVATPEAPDVDALLRIRKEVNFTVALMHDADAPDVADAVAAAGATAIVGPLDFSTPPRSLEAAAVYERAGAPVVIAGGLPRRAANSLRIGAALAVRYGMTPAAARRAISVEAARVLGVERVVGSLATGRRADIVVLTGDPLDLRARVTAVFVDGRRVSSAPLGSEFD